MIWVILFIVIVSKFYIPTISYFAWQPNPFGILKGHSVSLCWFFTNLLLGILPYWNVAFNNEKNVLLLICWSHDCSVCFVRTKAINVISIKGATLLKVQVTSILFCFAPFVVEISLLIEAHLIHEQLC